MWVSYFDLGFVHGFRNRFAEAVAMNDDKLAKQYVSTTYAVLSILFFILMLVCLFVNSYLDWGAVLNLDRELNGELRDVFSILICVFCVSFVANIFTTMLTASQKPALSSLITTLGNLMVLGGVFILTKTTSGSLVKLSLVNSLCPCLCVILMSIYFFLFTKYKRYAPSFRHVDFTLIKNIIGMGFSFFIIMISVLLIFQMINIQILRIEGPEAVTQYNIAYKIFGAVSMVAFIIINPFWSAFTNAYTLRDYKWMKKSLLTLEKLWLLAVLVVSLLWICSPYIYKFWVGDAVVVPLSLSAAVAVYVLLYILGAIYMYLVNGIGKVRIQLIVYVIFALISWPLMTWLGELWGVLGVLAVPAATYFLQSFVIRIQLKKILSGTATGFWNK